MMKKLRIILKISFLLIVMTGFLRVFGESAAIVEGVLEDDISLTWQIFPIADSELYTLCINGTGNSDARISDIPWNDYASQIKEIVFGDGVVNIPANIFSDNDGIYSSLEKINFSSTIEYIGSSAFANLSSMNQHNIKINSMPQNLKTVKNKAFLNVLLEGSDGTFVIPENVTEIGNYAFSIDKLTGNYNTIRFDNTSANVTIGKSAFYGWDACDKIFIPNISSIGKAAFYTSDATETTICFTDKICEFSEDVFGSRIGTMYYQKKHKSSVTDSFKAMFESQGFTVEESKVLVSLHYDEDKKNAVATLENYTDETSELVFFTALYSDENRSLTETVNICPARSVAAFEKAEYRLNFNRNGNSKAFVWNSFDSLLPLCNPTE